MDGSGPGGLQVRVGTVQGQERDAAEAGEDEPRHRGPQHEGAGGAVRQVRLNFCKHESSKFIHITTYMKNALF